MRISKTFSFDAAHRLPFHQGKCRNLHGHRYDVVITIEGNISEDINSPSQGMVKDFGELKVIKDWIDIHVDHEIVICFSPECHGSSYIGLPEWEMICLSKRCDID